MIKYPFSLPKPRVYQLPVEEENLFDGLEDLDIGPRWMGQQIRKNDMYVEFGGPKHGYQSFFLVEVCKAASEVVDGKVEIYGPEINELEPGKSYPIGYHFMMYGAGLTDEHTEFLERSAQNAYDHIENVMLINSRATTWSRIGIEVADRFSLGKLAQVIRASIRTAVPMVEAVEVRIIVGTPEVGGVAVIKEMLPDIKALWSSIDARQDDLDEDDVDMFYGCTICQSFAPAHVCVITPTRIPYCGIMSYNGAKISVELDPTGYVFEVEKEETLDNNMGWYSGVDAVIHRKSNGSTKKVNLFSSIKYPQTNCGCFEVITFYIPELDALGLVSRRSFVDTPLGLPFGKLAAAISGGAQNHGFLGISVRNVRSRTLMRGDGGWDRIVWMDSGLKAEVAEAIPEELYNKIATEETTIDIVTLKAFLLEQQHPIVGKFWENDEPKPLQVPAPGEDWLTEES